MLFYYCLKLQSNINAIYNYSHNTRHIPVSIVAREIPFLSAELFFYFLSPFSVASHRVLHEAQRGWRNSEPETHRHVVETLSGKNQGGGSSITHFYRPFCLWRSIIFPHIWCLLTNIFKSYPWVLPKSRHVRFY